MKWSVCLLLALAVLWLGWPRGGGRKRGDDVVESSRRVLDQEGRAKPEGEMTISEMERYAADLSDEELWEELGKAFGDWMAVNAGEERPEQPRLAIILARELGRRDGETGMRKVAKWLKERDGKLFEAEERDLRMEFQFFEVRVRVASYAGWVSDDPAAAISRLIESRKNEEEGWPVGNQGFLMYWKVPEFYAMEEVLREGFRDLQSRDEEKARELFAEGVGCWAFDVNEVVESFLLAMPKEEWPGWLGGLSEEIGVEYGETTEGGAIDSLWSLFREENWVPSHEVFLSEAGKRDQNGIAHLLTFARSRPELAASALRDEKISQEKKKWLFLGMALTDSRHYRLLSELDDDRKIEAVANLPDAAQQMVFGPLTGKEHAGELNRESLRSVIRETPMGGETRERLIELIGD